jgi:ABC-2 type transport system permease protein
MSISAPRYTASPVGRLGRTNRTLAIVRQQFLEQAGTATLLVVALMFLVVVLTVAVNADLASMVGQLTAGTFESPYESTVLPLLLLIVATVVGAGCIAEDVGSRSIVLYLSRPIHTVDYLSAKLAATGAWLLLATVGPGLVGVGLVAALGIAPSSVALHAAAGFLATGVVATVFFAGLVVALSSWTARSLYAGVAIFGVVLSLNLGVDVVFGITGNGAVRYVDPLTDLRSIAQVTFGVPGSHPTEPIASAVVLLGAGVLLAGLAALRLSRIEVVGE